MAPPRLATSHPRLFLVLAFTLYKTFLLLITAGTLMFRDYDTSSDRFAELFVTAPVSPLAAKLLRWDAVYFAHAARDGYVYEQEWAFLMGFSSVVRMAVSLLAQTTGVRADEIVMGVVVAHGAHLAAVLGLYQLTLVLLSLSAPSSLDDSLVAARRRA